MPRNAAVSADLVPIHIACRQPDVPEPGAAVREPSGGNPGARTAERPVWADAGIDWARLGFEPRWLGMESSDCAVALDPSIFYQRGDAELRRFLEGARSRDELALAVSTIGTETEISGYSPILGRGPSVELPDGHTFISGTPLPSGSTPSLADGVSNVDRDLALRLLARTDQTVWCQLSLRAAASVPGHACAAPIQEDPHGNLEPILVDPLGSPVVAAWVSDSGAERWYMLPATAPPAAVLDWLMQKALPALVPGALRRARSPLALDDRLQTAAETEAQEALDNLEARYAEERQRVAEQLEAARTTAEPMRHGLLYGTGDVLETAVSDVLAAAGLEVHKLDDMLSDTVSADLLVVCGGERRLIEVKSASGRAGEPLVGHLEKHLKTWPELRPNEPVGGGVLVVNHQHRIPPAERTPAVYERSEFVASLGFPVLSTLQLFDWWRASDWAAIRSAVVGPHPPEPSKTPSEGHCDSAATPSRRRWQSWRGGNRS